jgi:hypothetical protein
MLWRLHLRPAKDKNISYDELVNHCVQNQIAGIGWPVDGVVNSKEDYKKLALAVEDYKPSPAIRFAFSASINDLVWTRNKQGVYFLGKITGNWYYDASEEAKRFDIPNQRKCEWKKIGNQENIPGKIIACFRPPRAFQVINDELMMDYSRRLFDNSDISDLKINNEIDFFKCISSEDCEDIVGLYLQNELDYVLIPSSCKSYTAAYEFVLKHKKNGSSAVAQVKQGKVNLNDDLKYSADKIFLFTTEGELSKTSDNVVVLSKSDLFNFVLNNKNIIPEKIMKWLNC